MIAAFSTKNFAKDKRLAQYKQSIKKTATLGSVDLLRLIFVLLEVFCARHEDCGLVIPGFVSSAISSCHCSNVFIHGQNESL